MKNPAIEELKNNMVTNGFGLHYNSAVKGVYAYTNENLRQYMNLLNIEGKRVATVGSSGDQVFYSVFKGAEEVTLIDANPLSKPIVELKTSAIKNMSLDEFKDYWTKDKMLDPKHYKDLLHDVSEDTREFLSVYDDMKKSHELDNNMLKASSFEWRQMGKESKTRPWSDYSEFYDNNETFQVLKSNLKNCEVKYVLSELKDFNANLDGRYSTIMLSNIYDYYQSKKGEFFEIAKGLVDDRLTKDGTMQLHYKLHGYNYVDDRLLGTNFGEKNVKRYALQSLRGIELDYPQRKEYPAMIKREENILAGENLVYIYEKEMGE